MTPLKIMQKKLREARFFFRQLEAIAKRSVGDPEEFDFVLSAFLSASRSITDRLENRQYGQWYQAWRDSRSSQDRELLKFMCEQRIGEVHREGAEVKVVVEFVPVTKHTQLREDRRDRRSHPAYYGFHSYGPPGVGPPEIGVTVKYFKLGNTQVEASETWRAFVSVLNALVTAFAAAHPKAKKP
jgi:hypothetical protein